MTGTGGAWLVEQLLEMDLPVEAADKAGWTPLMWAAAWGQTGCIDRLLEAGALPSATDREGRMPLHWAAERGWPEAVALLVSAMAKVGIDCHMLVRRTV